MKVVSYRHMEIELYKTVWGDSTSDLIQKVNADIKFGWQPIGGVTQAVATTLGQERRIYIQAMVRFKK